MDGTGGGGRGAGTGVRDFDLHSFCALGGHAQVVFNAAKAGNLAKLQAALKKCGKEDVNWAHPVQVRTG